LINRRFTEMEKAGLRSDEDVVKMIMDMRAEENR
jgi:hypothetical protein